MTKFALVAFVVLALWVTSQQLDFWSSSTLAIAHQDYDHVKAENLPVATIGGALPKTSPKTARKLFQGHQFGLSISMKLKQHTTCLELEIPCDGLYCDPSTGCPGCDPRANLCMGEYIATCAEAKIPCQGLYCNPDSGCPACNPETNMCTEAED